MLFSRLRYGDWFYLRKPGFPYDLPLMKIYEIVDKWGNERVAVDCYGLLYNTLDIDQVDEVELK